MNYHTEITISFDGMEFLYGLTILLFFFSKGTDVLLCNWAKSRNELRCNGDGVLFRYVADRLIVTIPHASRNQSGVYSCLLIPSDGRDVLPCNLTITGKMLASLLDEWMDE